MRRLFLVLLATLLVVCLVVALVQANVSRELPLRWQAVQTYYPDPTDPLTTVFTEVGTMSHVGQYTDEGYATVVGFSPDYSKVYLDGMVYVTAANGDTLDGHIWGYSVVGGNTYAELEWVGGTGRFANVSGRASAVLSALPDGTVLNVGEGTISY